jgi:PAS domain S-box-containing protein
MALLLACSVAAMYQIGQNVISINLKLVDAQAVIDRLKDALSTLKDAETGQRGYVITGEPEYLEPYNASVSRVGDDLRGIEESKQRSALSPRDVTALRQLTAEKMQELAQTIQLRKERGFDAAAAVVSSGVGKQTMDQIRSLIDRMVADEKAEQTRLGVKSALATNFRTGTFIVIGLLNLVFLWWAHRRIQSGMIQRQKTSDELRQQKDLLAVTLASIGDGVIIADVDALVAYLNPEAEKLTGWTLLEARSQPCDKIFNIVNETSRQRVESPVDKVLRLGNVVGLANHTVLIRGDGTEVAIDDSGAPIRKPDGSILGVVLVFRDFSSQKRAASELLAAKEAAEAANVAKDNFLATLSHELRTPLTPVLTTLNMWESRGELPAALLPDVQVMRRNVELEARLIDDLLDLTRIVKGKLPLNLETADLHGLIESVTGMYQSEIHAKRLRLSLKLQAERHYVCGDPARLQQVFWNILKNATKFTSEGGLIEISSRNDAEGRVKLTFADSGIGMTGETLSRLFRPFEQGSAELVRQYGGLGLGMAISHKLVTAQGGGIEAQSDGPGRGATFTVTLSCVAEPDPEKCPPQQSPAVAEQQRALHILLVEDHVDTANAMSRLLRGLGHQVRVADSVSMALQSAREPFDLLLSDIGLPDGTGVELIRQIRERHGDRFPAVALTGYGMEDDVTRCKEAGFNEHLTKPVSLQNLQLVIQRAAAMNQ